MSGPDGSLVRCEMQGHGRRSNDSAGHSGVIAALPAMQRVSDQSAHAPSPTKLLAEGREGSSVPDYVPPQVRDPSVLPLLTHLPAPFSRHQIADPALATPTTLVMYHIPW